MPTSAIIKTAFSIVLIITALVAFMFATVRTFDGICWENSVVRTMLNIENDFDTFIQRGGYGGFRRYITVGSCVDAMFFANKETFFKNFVGTVEEVKQNFNCFEGFETMIAAVPKTKEVPSIWSALGDTSGEKLKEWGVNFVKEKASLKTKPKCRHLPCPGCVFKDPVFVKGPETGELGYCLEIKREKGTEIIFSITLGEISRDLCKEGGFSEVAL